MTREEVKVEFAGLAHDHHLAGALHHHHHQHHLSPHHAASQQQYQMKNHQSSSSKSNTLSTHHINSNSLHQHHLSHHHKLATQPLGGCLDENSPRTGNASGEACACPLVPTPAQLGTKLGDASALSTIAILRRHPMYDSLVLVKKYRPCLRGYSLEFPTSNVSDNSGPAGAAAAAAKSEQNQTFQDKQIGPLASENENGPTGAAEGGEHDSLAGCGRTKLVSVYLDGDDPIYQSQQNTLRQRQQQQRAGQPEGSQQDELVYVPVNGLLDRLDNYDRHGVAIDSRVYAFAMGLKTAERFLTSSTVKEMQEAPPL